MDHRDIPKVAQSLAGNGSLRNEPTRYQVWFWISIAVMSFVGGWLGIMAGNRDIPTTTYSVKAINPSVKPGEELRVAYVMRRHRSCETHVDRFIFDAENIRHVLLPLDFNPGLRLGEDAYTVPVEVPKNAKRGPARYSVISNYICNPLQRAWPIVGEQRDVFFNID